MTKTNVVAEDLEVFKELEAQEEVSLEEHQHIEDFVELIEDEKDSLSALAAFTIPGVVFKDVRRSLTRRGSYRRRSLSSIRNIVVHHSGTVTGSAEAYARYHSNTLKWPGIGYHIVIEQDGTVKFCNDLESISYHAGNANSYSVGVSMTGDFSRREPTVAQWTALYKVIEYLRAVLPKAKAVTSVIGHQECPGYKSKRCPSLNMDAMRGQLQAKTYKPVANKYNNDQSIKVTGGGIVATKPSSSSGSKHIGTVKILVPSLNVRKSDDVNSAIVGTVKENNNYKVYGVGQWGFNVGSGWVAKGTSYTKFTKL